MAKAEYSRTRVRAVGDITNAPIVRFGSEADIATMSALSPVHPDKRTSAHCPSRPLSAIGGPQQKSNNIRERTFAPERAERELGRMILAFADRPAHSENSATASRITSGA